MKGERASRLDLGPEVGDAVAEEFAIGVGYHGLINGLKRRTTYDEFDRAALADIVESAPSITDGLRDAGHYLDPASRQSGPYPPSMMNQGKV